ncbi:hypothetical protein DFH06DRAFT_355638 [Mycena polygramma]|nr:hypothetical protein DFH06DRAFT_355638 [Mycena polygramma]
MAYYSPYAATGYPQTAYPQTAYPQTAYPQTSYQVTVPHQSSSSSSSHHRSAHPPPLIQNPSTGSVGVPIHLCRGGDVACVQCGLEQRKTRSQHNSVRTSDNMKWLLHTQLNMCTATRARPSDFSVPPELGSLRRFDYTVQLPGRMQRDGTTWVFSKSTLVAVIGPMMDRTVTISKAFQTPGRNNTMVMRRIHERGPAQQANYCVEYILQSGDQFDIGCWAWYRYQDGSLRVWNYATHDNRNPCLVAWKEATDPHWTLHEAIAELMHSEAQVAAIVVICGMVVFSGGLGLVS